MDAREQEVLEWHGTLEPGQLKKSVVAAGQRLADSARSGDWQEVLSLLDDDEALNVSQVRPGGASWFTVLHQAAWHGAPSVIVEGLLVRGALRTLRDARGRTAHDLALERHSRRHALGNSCLRRIHR